MRHSNGIDYKYRLFRHYIVRITVNSFSLSIHQLHFRYIILDNLQRVIQIFFIYIVNYHLNLLARIDLVGHCSFRRINWFYETIQARIYIAHLMLNFLF